MATPTWCAFAPKKHKRPWRRSSDPLDAIYSGAKAPLRGLHDTLIAAIDKFGPYEKRPKSLHKPALQKQFAMLAWRPKRSIELGLNSKTLKPSSRLKAMPAGGMSIHNTHFQRQEIQRRVARLGTRAYDAAQ
ncbi:MAG: hypothetical protein IPP41_11870 [Rhodocyclaceae bacterium]|nr:hypothetical protein [Rhodocyclaceae bacterium]